MVCSLFTKLPIYVFSIYESIYENEVTQSCPTLCGAMDCSLPGSCLHGILQARVLEWVAISFSRGCSQPRDRTQVSCIGARFFTIWATREAQIRWELASIMYLLWGFPSGTVIKNPPGNADRRKRCRFNPWVGNIPWRRKWQSTPVFLPRKSHGQRSPVGYSPLGCKESDTTEWLNTCLHLLYARCLPQSSPLC